MCHSNVRTAPVISRFRLAFGLVMSLQCAFVPQSDASVEFSAAVLHQHVAVLADTKLQGRGLGTPELEQAAAYIADEFERIGLTPGGDADSFFQSFDVPEGEDGRPHTVRNVIGVLPGSNPAMDGQAVLVTAHYDHLGHGWPDSRAAERGRVYPGADDNASGVAVMIELAAVFRRASAPPRSLVFIAFTAEEAGLLGSSYFVQNPSPIALDGVFGVINMDTVGRLGERPLSVFGADSATEWRSLISGVANQTSIAAESMPGALDSSDHQSFVRRGIPGVQFSSGANLDYHRPTDTIDKIDAPGLVKVATFVHTVTDYLSRRQQPLTAAEPQEAQSRAAPDNEAGRRRVSLGTMPDFAFRGNGVRVEAIVPGSPAAQADLTAGDIVTKIGDRSVSNLQEFSNALKQLSPGDSVSVTRVRNGEAGNVDVTVVAR